MNNLIFQHVEPVLASLLKLLESLCPSSTSPRYQRMYRHDAPGTAGTAAAVPEFFHCLVGFSWCREKFYFLYI